MSLSLLGSPSYATELHKPLIRLSGQGDYLTLDDFFQGILVTGGIGSGKTSGSGHYLSSVLRAGFGAVIFCIKQGEAALWKRRAAAAGRSRDVIVIDGSRQSAKINFLQYLMATSPDANALVMNTVNALTTVIDSINGNVGQANGDNMFWQKAIREALTHLLAIQWAAYRQVDLFSLFELIQSRPTDRKQVVTAEWQGRSFMAHTIRLAEPNMHEMDWRASVAYLTQTLANPDQRVVGNIIASLSADLGPLVSGKLREIFAEGTSVTPEMTAEGAIIILDIPYETHGEAARLSQILFKLLFQKAMLARRRHPHMRPVLCWQDEYHLLASSFDLEFMSLTREARVSNVCLTQNISAMISMLGGQRAEDTVQAINSMLTTKIAHANTDNKTNQWYADMIGKGVQRRYSGGASRGGGTGESLSSGTSSSHSGGKSTSGGSFTYSRNGNLNWNQNVGFQEQMDLIVQPNAFLAMRKGGRVNNHLVDGIVIKGGTVFKHSGQTFLPVVFNQKA